MATEIKSYINVEITGGNSAQESKKVIDNLNSIQKEQKEYIENNKKSEKSTKELGKTTDRDLRKSERSWRSFVRNSDRNNGLLDRSTKKLIGTVGGLAAGYFGLVGTVRSVVTAYREFEDGLGGVRKTTGLAGKDLEQLGQNFADISKEIPITTTELLGLAQVAGQMGVKGSADIEKFSVTIAKLGRVSDVSGEEAAAALARILNVTGENISEIDMLASVVVRLGNNIEATESEIVRMTNEVARSTSIYGLSSAEAAGLAGAMKTMGIQAELGGTAIGKAMGAINEAVLKGGDDLERFASVIGVSGDALTQAWSEDKVSALSMMLEGIGAQGERGALALEELGLGGVQAAKALLPLATNTEKLNSVLAIANDEITKGTALNEEFEAVLGSLTSKWTVFKNNLTDAARQIGNLVLPAITSLLGVLNQTGAVEKFVGLLLAVAPVFAVGGGLVLGLKAVTAGVIGLSVALKGAVLALTPLKAIMLAVMAVWAGWELGKWAYREFSVVRNTVEAVTNFMANAFEKVKFVVLTSWEKIVYGIGIAKEIIMSGLKSIKESMSGTWESLVDGFEKAKRKISNGFEIIKFGADLVWEGMKLGFNAAIGVIQDGFAKMLGWVANLADFAFMDDMADSLKGIADGFGGTAEASANYEASVMSLRNQMNQNIAANNEQYQAFLDEESKKKDLEGVTDDLTDSTGDLTNQLSDLKNSTSNVNAEMGNLGNTAGATSDKVQEVLTKLREEQSTLFLSNEELRIRNALKEAGVTAESAAGREIAETVRQIEATEQAFKKVEEADQEMKEAMARNQEEIRDQWLRTRDTFSDFFVQMITDGESAFESLKQSFKAMLIKMAADMLASGVLSLFGLDGSKFGVSAPGGILSQAVEGTIIGDLLGITGATTGSGGSAPSGTAGTGSAGTDGTGGSGTGILGTIGAGVTTLFGSIKDTFSGLTDSIKGIFGGGSGQVNPQFNSGNMGTTEAGGFFSGDTFGNVTGVVKGLLAGVAGDWIGGELAGLFSDKQAESNIGSVVGGTIGSFGGPIGTLIGSAIGSAIDTFTGGDGYIRSNAGFFAAPTPGADPSETFGTQSFASGLNITGFNRRTSDQKAEEAIGIFRDIDAEITKLTKQAGGQIDLSRATLAGVGEDGQFGTSGTFFGVGGKTTDADLKAQLDSFSAQLVDHIGGLEKAVIDSLQSAGSTEDIVEILREEAKKAEKEKITEKKKSDTGTVSASGTDATVQDVVNAIISFRDPVLGWLTALTNAALNGEISWYTGPQEEKTATQKTTEDASEETKKAVQDIKDAAIEMVHVNIPGVGRTLVPKGSEFEKRFGGTQLSKETQSAIQEVKDAAVEMVSVNIPGAGRTMVPKGSAFDQQFGATELTGTNVEKYAKLFDKVLFQLKELFGDTFSRESFEKIFNDVNDPLSIAKAVADLTTIKESPGTQGVAAIDSLKENPYADQIVKFLDQLGISVQDVVSYVENAIPGSTASSSTPGFASGLDRVPYDNFAARLHKGERVMSAKSVKKQDELDERVQKLELTFQNYLKPVIKHTMKTAKLLDQWEKIGMPATRT